jgi:hypothetical protein
VVVAPALVWGDLVARLLYVGTPEDLMDATYVGQLVEVAGNQLTLDIRGDDDLAVVVVDNTIWYDNGPMERPAELPDDIRLRVLGVEEENEDGDDTVRAVLITPGRGH